MSIVNLGLQCVGIMRKQVGEEFEKKISNCKNLRDLRAACCDCKDEIVETLSPVKELLSTILKHLQLKGTNFQVFNSASPSEIGCITFN